MKFMSTWVYDPANAEAVTKRFMETGGQPPDGVTMEARWIDVAGGRGFAVCESDDPVAIAAWCREWSDLMTFEVIPVVNDQQIGEAIARGMSEG